jgi:hypothetical protein
LCLELKVIEVRRIDNSDLMDEKAWRVLAP